MDGLIIFQIVISILFIASVIFQKKSVGFSGALGGASSDENKSFYGNKRGLQKFLHNASIVLAVLMFGNALFIIIFS